MSATFNRKPAIRLGARVRVSFLPTKRGEPIEHRDGKVEFIREDDTALVRINDGWLHAERVSRLQVLA
jgi:hypothetical protein